MLSALSAQVDPDAAATAPFHSFPGLATSTGGTAEAAGRFTAIEDPTGVPPRLLLVPWHRPADAITVLGGLAGELEAEVISAVLRSWEERLGAVAWRWRLPRSRVGGEPASDAGARAADRRRALRLQPPARADPAGSLQRLASVLEDEHCWRIVC